MAFGLDVLLGETAMMRPEILEKFMFDVVEIPNRATETIRNYERA